MRMRRWHLITRSEDGVAILIVIMALVGLFGMVVLTVDVGGLMWKRRMMVRTADASALAAAQSCALGDPAEAGLMDSRADEYATANVANALASPGFETPIVKDSGGAANPGLCGTATAGSVSVGYQSAHELAFAPVLGFEPTRDVAAFATAIWGTAGSAHIVPAMFNLDWLTSVCTFPLPSPEGPEPSCAFLWDNDQIGSETWGLLNVNQWNVDAGATCTGAGGAADMRQVISAGGTADALGLNYPAPTYVCASSGLINSMWQTLADQVGNILFFPVNDQATQLPTPTDPPPANYSPDKFNIVGFIALRVASVDQVAASPDVQGTCDGDYEFLVDEGTELDLEALGVSVLGCAYEPPLKSIGNVRITPLEGSGGPFEEGTDYDIEDGVVVWTGDPQVDGVGVRFRWVTPGEAATCGEQITTNASGVCVVATWPGPQLGGGSPVEGGIDLGLRAIRLSE